MLQGTVDLLILQALSLGPMHGWGVSRRIRALSDDVLRVNQGSLYPALHRLEYRGLVRAKWGASANNRRAKVYSITARGARRLGTEFRDWERFVLAMRSVLEATEAPDLEAEESAV
ncbi:MAG: PadR family transcriptional regulator [Acidobacteria bacterium]|nr:PadR family transcriptional regulator [Acidobacteriota bacterium]